MKLQIPSSKHQRNFNLQAPSSERRLFEVWYLGFLWSLDVDAWSFSQAAVRGGGTQ